eukprot:3936214-Rhodomonas_salina.3
MQATQASTSKHDQRDSHRPSRAKRTTDSAHSAIPAGVETETPNTPCAARAGRAGGGFACDAVFLGGEDDCGERAGSACDRLLGRFFCRRSRCANPQLSDKENRNGSALLLSFVPQAQECEDVVHVDVASVPG